MFLKSIVLRALGRTNKKITYSLLLSSEIQIQHHFFLESLAEEVQQRSLDKYGSYLGSHWKNEFRYNKMYK